MRSPLPLSLAAAAALSPAAVFPARAQVVEYEEPPHSYYSTPVTDAGTRLDERLRSGETKLTLTDGKTLLAEVLRECGVPEASQVLVFSRTSVQRDRIRPWLPRAVFFNDETYIADVPGGLIEFAAMDPALGPVFHTLNPDRPDRPLPRLDRPDSCMDCHGGGMTNRVPGVMIRSVFPDQDGSALLHAGTFLTDHTSPLEERWGGWYVTGGHGASRHMGNVTATVTDRAITLDRAAGANRQSLAGLFPAERYLQPGSDIIALMVLEHQVGMHSRLVEAAYALRGAVTRQKALRAELGDPPTDDFTGTALTVARSHLEKILPYLLFAGEARLPEGGVSGAPEFQEAFRRNKIADPEGRSLKDFDLRTRLFRHRLSYEIYGSVFNALPEKFRAMLYAELWRILTASTPAKGYEYLSLDERQELVEILRSTKKDLPEYWRTAVPAR